jgi:hypothetical protein
MEEVKFITKRIGDDIMVANKNYGSVLGIIHVTEDNYTIDSEEKPFSHLRTAIECLIKNKVSC